MTPDPTPLQALLARLHSSPHALGILRVDDLELLVEAAEKCELLQRECSGLLEGNVQLGERAEKAEARIVELEHALHVALVESLPF